MNRALNQFSALALCALLAACGGGSGSGSDANGNTSSPGATKSSFTLRLTDAPVDDVAAVEMRFIEARVRRDDGTWINFPFDSPKTIDLLKLQGLLTADLLVDIPLGVGHYDEIRLLVDDAPMSSNIRLHDGTFVELDVPSGRSSGLTVKGDFMILKARPTTVVVDFDLRKSIKRSGNSGKYNFRPALRLVDDANAGHLLGIVTIDRLFSTPACSDSDVDTFNAVYVYEGHDVIPDDINQSSTTDVEPITTTVIKFDARTLKYKYEAAYLPEGDYTIAITCNANLDDLDSGADDLKFFGIRNVSVEVGNTLFL
ncbi:MAG: DUF4382 domain-containing protein [Gammaproteobacteria bacterium]|jgi:hypothetical protein|nr:DUF4382 domain-containing protein [Gammaproteobacteria bacterium]